MPYNPFSRPKRVLVNTIAVSVNASGIVGVTAELRAPQYAWANYMNSNTSGEQGSVAQRSSATSGIPTVQVVQLSGNVADVQFLTNASGVSGIAFLSPATSGVMFSGGSLNVWFEGD